MKKMKMKKEEEEEEEEKREGGGGGEGELESCCEYCYRVSNGGVYEVWAVYRIKFLEYLCLLYGMEQRKNSTKLFMSAPV